MAQKYIIIKQYLHSAIFPTECTKEYYKCTAAKKSKKALAQEYKSNEESIKSVTAKIEEAKEAFCKTRGDKTRARLYARLVDEYRTLFRLRAFEPKDYILRYKKVDHQDAKALIEVAGLKPVLDNEDGTIWDTPGRFFQKFQGNITIPTNIGY